MSDYATTAFTTANMTIYIRPSSALYISTFNLATTANMSLPSSSKGSSSKGKGKSTEALGKFEPPRWSEVERALDDPYLEWEITSVLYT